ncbi:hypothetical protein BP6252_10080 [Coleophoma cylindrospora]|uniref:Uncharacterized protein n=1 Tax=Coleophoma cylindrospora TaxID=1849047 RepID=A0A3D8QXF4_9HELO|nr:hypothetical protein BP6252_10080 [Coleophoma cylindrospora]
MVASDSSSGVATPTNIPATPLTTNAELPVLPDVAQVSTSSTSANEASASNTMTARSRDYQAMSEAAGSMTPPPSTQPPESRRSNRGDALSMLSSPPPTITNGTGRDGLGSPTHLSEQHIDTVSADQLRDTIRALTANASKTEAALAESRMTIAHLNLQMNMLSAEKESELQRMEVEHNMTKREVDMLSMARSDITTPGSSLLTNYIKLDEKHQALVEHTESLHRRLERAKKVIETKDDEILDLKEDIAMYRKRIQEKHDLYQALRSPGGPYHSSNLKTPTGSNPNTPQQYRGTPKRTPMTGRSVGREEPFAALLLADRVLSQENNSNSAPSTPVLARRPEPRTPVRHHRGAQSLSSLQTTPASVHGHVSQNASLLPSAQFQPSPRRRRKSRDSTISAPDAEEIARAALSSFRDDSEEIDESQASQTATEMLRVDPRESYEVAASRTGTPVQSKIFSTVTKAQMVKRKHIDDNAEQLAKKARLATDIGLGIGFSART